MAMMRLRREDPRVVGSYRLHRRLGAGGMGVVYLGSDKRGQRVALKVIRPDLAEDQEFRSRFAREVSAARRIRGGCTARLVAADLDADRPWFATQYVPGPSLHDKVNDEGPLHPAQVASIGAALSEGLLAVHDAGVVHRDLKPSNILLSPKGPRIIDFGIAWATGASTLTHVGTAVGSPGFLAPEQVRGAAVTPATDIFALGATLAYACTADSPFGQGSSEVMLYRVVHEEAQLSGVPDALAPLLAACLAKDPADRPSTLSLSLRLKEIAAREAQGLSMPGGPGGEVPPGGAGRLRPGRGPSPERGAGAPSERSTPARAARSVRPQADRPTGKRAEEYARQRTERRAANTPTPRPQAPRASGAGRGAAPVRPQGTPGASSAPGAGAPGAGPSGEAAPKSRGGRRPSARPSVPGARTPGRNGSRPARVSRTGSRTSPGARRPGPDRRLLRQRIIVFITVTLLVALGIAVAQGCQGPARSLGPERSAYGTGHVSSSPALPPETGRN
ncbi:serine/threonine protein kinase [Streptomyces sp. WAC 06725]|uniref:serine/threonine protein kinase n=1 Tax=Streptomyces sp. WAC 06725 TaxID=2203209 RepID=UPI000F741BF3|nr:serine/threonine protein kinase [Streptomyces sp. WAC 06725]RSO14267.1 serine/threonine protein kinase [Streptomyces sp. WAC 06725]